MKIYHYTECGLDNIYLDGGFSIAKNGTLSIRDIHGLHREIAEVLANLSRPLKGKEIRFIRHYFDINQKTLGEQLCVSYQAVLRWEKSKSKITKTADRFLKVLLYGYLHEDASTLETVKRLSDRDAKDHEDKIEMQFKKDWAIAA